MTTQCALAAEAYDEQWKVIDDFILHHPGARHRRRLVFSLIHRTPAGTLLDVGCGNGELLSMISKEFPDRKLSGADLSPEVISKNAQRFPTIDFTVLDIEKESQYPPSTLQNENRRHAITAVGGLSLFQKATRQS